MTINQLRGFLAFMVKNNQQGVIDALKSSGYTPPTDAAGLVDFLMNIYSTRGTNELIAIFAKVKPDASKATNEEFNAIRELTTGQKVDPASKFSLSDFAALWGGSTVTTGDSSSTTKKPALSPTAVVVVSVLAIAAIVLVWKIS